jgi:hypothetical protein
MNRLCRVARAKHLIVTVLARRGVLLKRSTGDCEQQAVVAVIRSAFSTEPMARWTFPDPATYLRVWPEAGRALGTKISHIEPHTLPPAESPQPCARC